MNAADEVEMIRKAWPAEFRDGARCGFLYRFDGERERGGYPRGFRAWELSQRNAWFAGFNVGFHDRIRFARKEAA
jgi:hypothetical protein